MSLKAITNGAAAEAKLWADDATGLPQAPFGYLFPVQAIAIAGQGLLGEAGWAGNEMRLGSMQYRPLPDLSDEKFDHGSVGDTQKRYLAHFLAAHAVIRAAGGSPGTDLAFTKVNWDRIREASEIHGDDWAMAKVRLQIVVTHLGRLAEAGAMKTVYRKKGGGEEPKPIPAAWWSLDDFTARFRSCALDPAAPSRVSTPLPAWFFLEEAAVREACLPTHVPEVSTTTIEGVHLSPYLQLMIDVAKETKIGPAPENQVGAESLYATIKQMADDRGIDLTESEWKKMATFVREPYSKQGSRKVMADQRRDAISK